MTDQKISDLTPGSPPYNPATLLEVSIPDGASHDSRSAQLSDLVPTTMLSPLVIDWDSNTLVAAGTSIALQSSPWASATIESITCVCTGGSFTVEIEINGTPVTGLSAVTVNSTPATTNATGANTVSTGNTITAVISGVTSAPTTAVVQINLQTSFN